MKDMNGEPTGVYVKRMNDVLLSDRKLFEHFEFCTVREDEAEEVSEVEAACFPPGEACTPERMKERISAAKDIFLVVKDKAAGSIIGFVNGIATNDTELKDQFYTDASLHDTDGKNVMICSVCVLPEYRKQGIAREMICEYCRRESARNRKKLILTCKKEKVRMYEKFGFVDMGTSDSSWGGTSWNQMELILNK